MKVKKSEVNEEGEMVAQLSSPVNISPQIFYTGIFNGRAISYAVYTLK